jgi:hypothetical protein
VSLFEKQSVTVNWNLTPDWIRRSKYGSGIGPGVQAAIEMMRLHERGPGPAINWGGCNIAYFYHSPLMFSDENSLSVVIFVHYGMLRIVFPGDLTKDGWSAFLRDNTFRSWLSATNIFVASGVQNILKELDSGFRRNDEFFGIVYF